MQVIKGSLQCTEMTHFNLNSSHEMYKSDKNKGFFSAYLHMKSRRHFSHYILNFQWITSKKQSHHDSLWVSEWMQQGMVINAK